MSKPSGRVFAAALLALVWVLPARGQSTVQLKDAGSTAAFGDPAGPYHEARLTSGIASSVFIAASLFAVYRLDFAHDVFAGETWTAYVKPLAGGPTATRGDNAALEQYRNAVWLSTQFAMAAPSGAGDFHVNGGGDFHGTSWGIMQPRVTAVPEPWSSHWPDQAFAHYLEQGADFYRHFAVITPTNELDPTSAQELPTMATPEPADEILLAFGFITIAGLLWWRRRASLA